MRRKTIEEVREEIFSKVGNEYTLLSKNYNNKREKLEFLHNNCGREFSMSADGFLNLGSRCKFCASNRSWAYTTKEFSEKILSLTDGNDYEVCEEYKNTHTKIKFLHKICNRNFEMTPNNFLIKGNRCPFCSISKGEEFISNFLRKNKCEFKQQVPISFFNSNDDHKNLKFDFLLIKNSENVLIEYDGRLHYEPYSNSARSLKKFNSQKDNDSYKNAFCKKHKIKLIRISYKDFNNLENILTDILND